MSDIAKARLLGESRAHAFLPPGEFQSILVPPLSPPFRSIPYTQRRAKGPRARSCTKMTISCEGMLKLACNSANLSRICRMQARFEPSNSTFSVCLGNRTQLLRNLSSFLYTLPEKKAAKGWRCPSSPFVHLRTGEERSEGMAREEAGCSREMRRKKGPSCCTRRNPRSLREPRHHGKEKAPLLGLDFEMVDRRGLEPRTLGLRVPCSTN